MRDERRVFFNVSFVVTPSGRRLLAYGLCTPAGEPLLEVHSPAASPALGEAAPGPVEPELVVDAFTLSALMLPVCAGARLVGFHRVLQAGLLPPAAAEAARGFACAWRRQRLHSLGREAAAHEDVSDPLARACLEAGVEPPSAPAALPRAQAIARLWARLDRDAAPQSAVRAAG